MRAVDLGGNLNVPYFLKCLLKVVTGDLVKYWLKNWLKLAATCSLLKYVLKDEDRWLKYRLEQEPTCSLLKYVLKDEDRWLKYRLKLSVTAILSAILRLRKVQGLGGRATRGIWTSGSLQTLQVKTERPIMIMIKSAGQDSAPGQVTGNLLLKTRQQDRRKVSSFLPHRCGHWQSGRCAHLATGVLHSTKRREAAATGKQHGHATIPAGLRRYSIDSHFSFFFKFKRLSPQPYP